MSRLKKHHLVSFFGPADTVCHQAAPFPFTDHLNMAQADAVQILRARMSDEHVLALFHPESAARERVAGFLKRNPRQKDAVA